MHKNQGCMSSENFLLDRRSIVVVSADVGAATLLAGKVSAALARLLRRKGRHDPGAGERLSDEIYAAPESWAERACPKLIHYNKFDEGGHFAAWEQPALFTAELRASFKSLRQAT